MDDAQPFGRGLSQCASADELLELERRVGKQAPLGALADVVERIVDGAFKRSTRTILHFERGKDWFVRIDGVSKADRVVIDREITASALNARGAWFLPEHVSLRPGLVNLPSHFRVSARYAHNMAADDRVRTELASGDSVLLWAILEPLFELLLRPLDLFGARGDTLAPDDLVARFSEAEEFLVWSGLATRSVLEPLRPEARHALLPADDIVRVKMEFLSALGAHLASGMIQRYRAHVTRRLASQYYAKAKNGRAKRKQVVAKAFARDLIIASLGDWSAFVGYLGEELHADERIVISVPEPTLHVASREQALHVATQRGLPVEEVEHMLAVLWGEGHGDSPVHERVRALAAFWAAFDELHAAQQSGMPSLWGLLDETTGAEFVGEMPAPYRAGQYRKLLPKDLCLTIDQLWGSTVLPRFPDCVVSEPFPHARMAAVLGPAARLWNGCALTAWFFCEGPWSRTDLEGLAHYHREELAALEDLGCPVHPRLFDELKTAERRLGPEESIMSDSTDVGLGMTVSISHGTRRRGFEILREIVTRHRRWWAEHFLTKYLEILWRAPLRDAGQKLIIDTVERGKPPTLKQFAKQVVPTAASWFGGDVRLLYVALGQKASFETQRRKVMPADVGAFIQNVHMAIVQRVAEVGPREGAERVPEYLAVQAPYYVQLLEALGRPPLLKEFGEGKLTWMGSALKADSDTALAILAGAVSAVLPTTAN